MLKIAFDPIYAHPLPEGHRFPMLKYELIPQQLLREGIITGENLFEPGIVDEDTILLTHERQYWEHLRDLTLPPKEERRIGFPLSAQLVEREMRIAKGTIDGCHFAFEHGVAFNVAGGTHHAGTNWGEGFCLLNDQAIAANHLLLNELVASILIIDLDVHQATAPRRYLRTMRGYLPFRCMAPIISPSVKSGRIWISPCPIISAMKNTSAFCTIHCPASSPGKSPVLYFTLQE